MNLRNKFKQDFTGPVVTGYLPQLYGMIGRESEPWFSGIINSLWYRVNHNVLVIKTPHPDETSFIDSLSGIGIYESLVIVRQFEKSQLDIPSKDDFTVSLNENNMPEAEKRLASYATVVEAWHYPPRKNFIEVIDNVDYNWWQTVDKQLFWIELFNTYKSK